MLNELIVVGEHLEQGGEIAGWVVESVVNGVAVGEVEGLDEAGLIGTLTFAGDFSLVSSERFEEVGTHGGVVELSRAGSWRVKVRFFGAPVVHHDGVELFRHSRD